MAMLRLVALGFLPAVLGQEEELYCATWAPSDYSKEALAASEVVGPGHEDPRKMCVYGQKTTQKDRHCWRGGECICISQEEAESVTGGHKVWTLIVTILFYLAAATVVVMNIVFRRKLEKFCLQHEIDHPSERKCDTRRVCCIYFTLIVPASICIAVGTAILMLHIFGAVDPGQYYIQCGLGDFGL
eukprot:s6657_g2.t1